MLLTVIGTADDEGQPVLLCSTNIYLGNTDSGAGILTLDSGSGPNSIDYLETGQGFDQDYYSNFGRPEGHWVAVPGDGMGRYVVNSDEIAGKVQLDKISFLIHKDGNFSLSDIFVEWTGTEDKPLAPLEPFQLTGASGAELLTENYCGTPDQLSRWTYQGSIVSSEPPDGVLPSGCSGMVEVGPANILQQEFVYPESSVEDREVLITLWARRFPPIFDPTVAIYPEESQVTRDSYDYATLRLDLVGGKVISPLRDKVGLHWKEVRLKTRLPAKTASQVLRVYSESLPVQVAFVSVKFME